MNSDSFDSGRRAGNGFPSRSRSLRLASSRTLLMAAAMLIATSLIPAAGCSRGPRKAVFTGRVTLDGQALSRGAISLYPRSRNPSAGAVIEDGGYRMEAFPGSYRVEITGSKVVGQKPDVLGGPMDDIFESIVPAKYNSASEVVQEITLDTKTLDFTLVTPAGN